MSIFKRAILYISRNKTRTILLVIILAFLMLISLNGIAIKSSVDRESEKVRSEYGSSFIIESNYDDFDADEEVIELEDGTTVRIYTGPKIVDEAIEEICSVSGVEGYNEGGWCGVYYFSNIELLPGLFGYMYEKNIVDDRDDAIKEHRDDYIWSRSATCYSNRDPEHDAFFENGSFELDSGRMISIEGANEAMVSKRLAEKNGLNVGDHISLEIKETCIDVAGDPDKIVGEPVDLEIVGIYRINFSLESSIYTPENENPENFIYISRNTAKQLTSISNAHMGLTPGPGYSRVEFYVDSPSKLDGIIQEVKDLDCVNWQFCSIKKNDATYRSLLKPLETVGGYSSLMLFLSFGAGGILAAFIIMMQLRSRKKELSIYSYLGFVNKNIKMQLIIEIIMIILISFLFMLLLSYFLSGPIKEMITDTASMKTTDELYTVESTKIGIEITQTAGELPDIDISNSPGDYVMVFAVFAAILLLVTSIVSGAIIKRLNKE